MVCTFLARTVVMFIGLCLLVPSVFSAAVSFEQMAVQKEGRFNFWGEVVCIILGVFAIWFSNQAF